MLSSLESDPDTTVGANGSDALRTEPFECIVVDDCLYGRKGAGESSAPGTLLLRQGHAGDRPDGTRRSGTFDSSVNTSQDPRLEADG
jgi:hypothetical protein